MSGIYIHIPFCKQACNYCDFHFSTSLKKKGELVNALCTELVLRKEASKNQIETIYFGGGTPSLLTSEELQQILHTVYDNYKVSANPEITLEANPDDLTHDVIARLADSPINRLSIGIQSFFDQDLKLMNRAHNAHEALHCVQLAKRHFDNISIDLIYGVPGMDNARWTKNIDLALHLEVPHLSCYALNVEPRTALKKFIDKGLIPPVDEEVARQHYDILLSKTNKAGFENYEFSNFGIPGYHSRNNTAYWEGKSYIGIGPSAHSYNRTTRSWNVAKNTLYIKSITTGKLPSETEVLSKKDQYNEYIMTGLRTAKGVSIEKINREFGNEFATYLQRQAAKPIGNGLLFLEDKILRVSDKGKFLSDGIAADLFLLN